MTAQAKLPHMDPPAPVRKWRALYKRRRTDGTELAVIASDGGVLIRSGDRRVFLERDEVGRVRAALEGAEEEVSS